MGITISKQAQEIHSQISGANTKMGDIKKIAKDIKVNHDLAMELWSTENPNARLLSTLILDKKLLNQDLIDALDRDLQVHADEEKHRIMEWLMANQLMKSKKTVVLILSWDEHPSPLLRRTYWYYQGRLRWTGQKSPENTSEILDKIEANLADEHPEVQWAMNFTAGWIGVFNEEYRQRCKQVGERTQLYKDEVVPRGCTPSYLPLFIDIEVGKRQ